MTEENKGAAVALPATDYTLAIPARPYEPAYVTNEEGFSAEAMLAFRAEGEADLRARLAAAENAIPHDLIPRLQSFLDRLRNDTYAGTMFEADADALRDSIRLAKDIKRIANLKEQAA